MTDPLTTIVNDAFVAELWEAYRRDPASVDESWRQYFAMAQKLAGSSKPDDAAAPLPASGARLAAPEQDFARRVVGISRYLNAIRRYGFLAVQLDPLGSPPPGARELTLEHYGISDADLDLVTGEACGFPHLETARDVAERLKFRYTRNLAVEFVHCRTEEERQWFRALFTAERLTRPLSAEEKKALLVRLSEVDGFERFLGRAFVGSKRFSIEGCDALVPMLDTALDEAAAAGARHVAIAMAHRGRLNVLAHVMGKPVEHIIAEFLGRHDHLGGSATGDVKYHLGFVNDYHTRSGRPIRVTLVPNPSHLEMVNPVLQGLARALQRHRGRPAERDPLAVVPICIHGDAAFPGEGIVAETINLAHLRGYTVGGTLHLIVNNQIGFTTEPDDARSTRFASDLAKGFEMPVIHVNADDAEACVIAMRIAVAYRTTFGRDFLVDLVGYRRHGHNEGDEPAYTQPLMYERIRAHPTARQVWGTRLVNEGIVTRADVDAADAAVTQRLQAAYDAAQRASAETTHEFPAVVEPRATPRTAVDAKRLMELNEALLTWPDSLRPNPRLARQFERRRPSSSRESGVESQGGGGGSLDSRPSAPDFRIDWGHAEALAFATILAEGRSVRLTGQDAERGTFSHRHAVLHDVTDGHTYTPLQHVPGATGAFEIWNSPLSEAAVMGFEYGFSVAAADTLTVWEAQFGDFANVAQPIIDQFLAADHAKWGQDSGLVLLLPHGYEGQGPEHSSARLERFLQLCAEGNLRVVYPTTPAQYFHLLRRQALVSARRPLVVMTPKSLLRLPQAGSRLEDLAEGEFHPVLDDPRAADPASASSATSEAGAALDRGAAKRLVLCTGKVFYDLMAKVVPGEVAVVRVEELHPWPHAELTNVLDRYTAVTEIVWAQEEPKNQGAWTWVSIRLRGTVGNAVPIRYVGRPERAATAEGYTQAHNEEQARIVAEAMAVSAKGPTRRSSSVLNVV
jgi:2-oxoglutarate dehydrogenase E1 component